MNKKQKECGEDSSRNGFHEDCGAAEAMKAFWGGGGIVYILEWY
jgi:hypothetical protein